MLGGEAVATTACVGRGNASGLARLRALEPLWPAQIAAHCTAASKQSHPSRLMCSPTQALIDF
jgi:hypothetical protein